MSKYVGVLLAIITGIVLIFLSRMQVMSISTKSYEVLFVFDKLISDIFLLMGAFVLFSSFIGLLTIIREDYNGE